MFGHLQNYCFVFGRCFVETGRHVVVAGGHLPNTSSLLQAELLREMREKWNVELVDLGDISGFVDRPGSMIPQLLGLEDRFHPEWTFIPAGDHIQSALAGLGSERADKTPPRLANFNSVSYIYRQPRYLFEDTFSWLKHGVGGYYKRRYLENNYYRQDIWQHLGIVKACSPLGDFVDEIRDTRIFWFPDIFRAWGSQQANLPSAFERVSDDYLEFLGRNSGREVILYFGGWCRRRGYDLLLKLCADEPRTAFVSVGRPVPGDSIFRHDVRSLKADLQRQGRIFERELPFLPDNDFTDALFESISFLVLPYDEYLGLSGLLIQAAWYRKPVVVPCMGYMGNLVQRNGIGMTYRPRSMEALRAGFRQISTDTNKFEVAINRFRDTFSYESVRSHLYAGLGWPESPTSGVSVPVSPKSASDD